MTIQKLSRREVLDDAGSIPLLASARGSLLHASMTSATLGMVTACNHFNSPTLSRCQTWVFLIIHRWSTLIVVGASADNTNIRTATRAAFAS